MTTHDALTARLSELLAKATPGPWEVRNTIDGPLSATGIRTGDRRWVARCASMFGRPHVSETKANAALIVETINALPTLLSERAILIAERDEARALLEPFAAVGPTIPKRYDDEAQMWAGLSVGDFRAARAYLTKGTSDGR